jgi:hypothetical protein
MEGFMKWCCLGFEGNYGEAGKRGTGILVGRDFEGRAEFTLQYRAVDKGNEQSVTSQNPISLAVDLGMRFCPGAGAIWRNGTATASTRYIGQALGSL